MWNSPGLSPRWTRCTSPLQISRTSPGQNPSGNSPAQNLNRDRQSSGFRREGMPKSFYKNPVVAKLAYKVFSQGLEENKTLSQNTDDALFFYRWIMALSNGQPISINFIKENLPLWDKYSEQETPTSEKFNRWSAALEDNYSLCSMLRENDGVVIGKQPSDECNPQLSLEDTFEKALQLYGTPVEFQREEAKMRKALKIEKLEAKKALELNPTRTRLFDLPLVDIDTPLSKSILQDPVELSKLLRTLLVANGGQLEYSTLLQLLDMEWHDDRSFWMETITPGIDEFEDFYWEIDPNAPERAKCLFLAGKSSQSDAVFYFWLKLRELTLDEQKYFQQLTTSCNFIPQMVTYFLEKELEFEEKANICKVFDLDPNSSLALIAKLSNDVFTYNNWMHRLIFHKEKWAKEEKKATGVEEDDQDDD